MSDPFLAQLTALCREHSTRAKWVFVPSHAVGLTIGDRLAREGADWVNLHVVTPFDVAVRMAAPFLLERGVEPSEEPLGPPLVMRLLLDLPVEGGYFRPMAEHASMADALWRTIRDLRFAGLRASDLPADAFRSDAKFRELTSLIRAYEDYLAGTATADMAVVYEEALARQTFCPIQPGDVWTELPDAVWAPVVRRFLDALRGTHEPARIMAIDHAAPERMRALAGPTVHVETVRPPQPKASEPPHAGKPGRAQFQLPFADAEPEQRRSRISVVCAGGHDAEIEEVIRRILASGRRLDEVEIVCVSETHALVAWEKARRLDWPVTVSAGIPARMTRPGRALHGWCEWIESGFAAARLRRMLESGDVGVDHEAGDREQATGEGPGNRPHGTGRGEVCSAQQAAKILRRAEATWGRATYRASLSSYADRQDRRAAEHGADEPWRLRRAAQARWLIGAVEDLLAPIPDPAADGTVAVIDVLAAAEAFLSRYPRRAGDLDAAGLLAVADAIRNLHPLGAIRGPLSWVLRFVTGAVQSTRVGRSRSKPGHLHLSMFADPGYEGRPAVFVCGLEEGRVFPVAIEDPVLLDSEREVIERRRPRGLQPWLRTAGDRIDEAVYLGLARLARIGTDSDEVVLSYSAIDTREFRESFPSWLVLRAYRAASGNPGAGYAELKQASGDPVSVVPAAGADASSTAAWWMHAGRMGQRAVGAVIEAYPAVGRGRLALAARASEAFTEFDGYAPDAGRLLDPSRNDMTVSATMLESAADCPFRYFLEAGLGIEPLEEDEADADVWLDPLRRGSELHAFYAALLRRARADDRRVSAVRDLDWFIALGEARLAELRQEIPPPSEEVAARESAELLEDLRLFVAAEEATTGIEPIAFEVSFGRSIGDDGEALASPDPVVMDLGGHRRLVVAGRIDRIDRILAEPDSGRTTRRARPSSAEPAPSPPASYRIVDYKTGRFRPDAYAGTFRRGTLLQHGLYGVAAARLLESIDRHATVSEGVYWHPTARGWGRRVPLPAPSPGSLEHVLALLCDVLGSGLFLPAPERQEKGQRFKKDACRYCDFKSACGAAPGPVSARKAQANADDRLAPWLALQEVE